MVMEEMGKTHPYISTRDVMELAGIKERTVHKYAVSLNIPYLQGNRKTYLWTEADVERLKEALKMAKVGRPQSKQQSTT